MSPLGLLSPGEKAEIMAINTKKGCGLGINKDQCGHIEDIGLRVGKTVEMLNNGGGGPILLRVDESRIALARGMAMRIMVEREVL
ncbi:MAG: ferrous iron transport protein A [Deltaproteobacteria bacterium]|nr:ferrous iron transport protein A [Deltaproteobacteria bacterium]